MLSRKSSIFLSLLVLASTLLIAHICSTIAKNGLAADFPNFWSSSIQACAFIVSLVSLSLTWVFKKYAIYDAEKRNLDKNEQFYAALLLVGIAFAAIPTLLGFGLFIIGGNILATYFLIAASFIACSVWLFFSLGTYLKKSANQRINADGK